MKKDYLKGRLDEIKKNLTEKQFFSSEALRMWLQKMAQGISGRFDIRVLIGEMLPTATDNKTIWAGTRFTEEEEKLSLVDKVLMIIGSVAHETYHIIYTDFTVLKKLDELRHHFLNIVEDSAIEFIGCAYYFGWFKIGLELSNKINFRQRPSLSEMAKKGALRADLYTEACLTYALMGKVRGKVPKSIVEEFRKAMPLLDAGRLAVNTKGRLYYSDRVLELGREFFNEKKDLTDLLKMLPHQPQNNGSSQAQRSPQPGSSGNPDEEKTQTQKNAEKTKQKYSKKKDDQKSEDSKSPDQNGEAGAGDEKDPKENPESKSGGSEGEPKENEDDKSEASDGKDSKAGQNGPEDKDAEDKDGKSGKSKDKTDEDGKDGDGDSSKKSPQKDDKSDDKSDGEGESKENEDSDVDYDEDYGYTPPDLSDLEDSLASLEDEVAKEVYDNEEDRKMSAKIQDFNKKIQGKFGFYHSHIKVFSHYDNVVSDMETSALNRMMSDLGLLIKSLEKKLQNVIRFNENCKLTGLFSGKPNTSQLYRQDQRVFYKRKAKSDEADMVVLVAVDESASMKSYNRIGFARQACLILYMVAQSLNIPFAVIGHRANYGSPVVNIDHIVDWDVRKDQRANIMKLRPDENTREGVSIRYAAEYLRQRKERDKFLLVISDGAPEHDDGRQMFRGKPVADDIVKAIRQYPDIRIIGVAIGDSKTEIKHLYKECLDIQDLNELPVKLTNLIKDNLLKGA